MTPRLTCPHAQYRDGMRIFCARAADWCGHVYFKQCKGWWVLSDMAARCPLRKDDEHGPNPAAAQHGDDRV